MWAPPLGGLGRVPLRTAPAAGSAARALPSQTCPHLRCPHVASPGRPEPLRPGAGVAVATNGPADTRPGGAKVSRGKGARETRRHPEQRGLNSWSSVEFLTPDPKCNALSGPAPSPSRHQGLRVSRDASHLVCSRRGYRVGPAGGHAGGRGSCCLPGGHAAFGGRSEPVAPASGCPGAPSGRVSTPRPGGPPARQSEQDPTRRRPLPSRTLRSVGGAAGCLTPASLGRCLGFCPGTGDARGPPSPGEGPSQLGDSCLQELGRGVFSAAAAAGSGPGPNGTLGHSRPRRAAAGGRRLPRPRHPRRSVGPEQGPDSLGPALCARGGLQARPQGLLIGARPPAHPPPAWEDWAGPLPRARGPWDETPSGRAA